MDAVPGGKVHHGLILKVGAEFHLVGGDLARTSDVDGLLHQRHREVGHPDLRRQPLLFGLHQRTQRVGERHCAVFGRPVDQRQVHLVGAQSGQAVFQAGNHLVSRRVVLPDLGGDEHLGARHAAGRHGPAHVGFIAVDLRGVDGAVAQGQRRRYRVDDDLVLEAKRAQTQGGNIGNGGGGGRCIDGWR